MSDIQKRYSDDDLQEFKEILLKKMDKARKELDFYQEQIRADSDDSKFSGLEDGTMSMERENLNQLASRQIKFMQHLEKALIRIENKTYGICRETGKLISKERLRAVPHATLCIEAKLAKAKK
ncbi:MAG: TraR/DksA family transcriptional regulator [Bacteroidetes bacterium]|nr:TraR/DksA family transcriptional regulator [Bacteroidota bacterium]